MLLDEIEVLVTITDDLRLALRQLTGPACAAEVVEAGEFDDPVAPAAAVVRDVPRALGRADVLDLVRRRRGRSGANSNR